jgi:Uma2 family endonuclease
MASPSMGYVTPADYLAWERGIETRNEYHDGKIVALPSGNWPHNLIMSNLIYQFRTQLRGRPCEAYAIIMRLRIPARNLYLYADLAAVCGTPQFEDSATDTLLNPTLLVEVLSPASENYDRGKKFAHYRTLPSLSEYLLIAQDEYRIDYYRREAGGLWFIGDARGFDATLPLVIGGGCTLALADIYEEVALPG